MSKKPEKSSPKIQRKAKEDVPVVISAMHAIKEGRLSPQTLSTEIRQQCVEELAFDGFKVSEIAALLKRSERTIHRDLDAIRKKNAKFAGNLEPKELLGNHLHSMTACVSRAARAARDKDAKPADKVEAARVMGLLLDKQIALLERLGHLERLNPDDGGTRVTISFDDGPVPQPGDPDPGDPDPPNILKGVWQ